MRDISLGTEAGIKDRLQANLESYNAEGRHAHQLLFSLGVICIDPAGTSTVDELLTKADQAMYEHKRSRQAVTMRE